MSDDRVSLLQRKIKSLKGPSNVDNVQDDVIKNLSHVLDEKAMNIIFEIFPKKVAELTDIYQKGEPYLVVDEHTPNFGIPKSLIDERLTPAPAQPKPEDKPRESTAKAEDPKQQPNKPAQQQEQDKEKAVPQPLSQSVGATSQSQEIKPEESSSKISQEKEGEPVSTSLEKKTVEPKPEEEVTAGKQGSLEIQMQPEEKQSEKDSSGASMVKQSPSDPLSHVEVLSADIQALETTEKEKQALLTSDSPSSTQVLEVKEDSVEKTPVESVEQTEKKTEAETAVPTPNVQKTPVCDSSSVTEVAPSQNESGQTQTPKATPIATPTTNPQAQSSSTATTATNSTASTVQTPPKPKMVCQALISEMICTLKRELMLQAEYLNTLAMWVELNVPSMDTTYSFGVEVQNEILDRLNEVKRGNFAVLDNFSNYHRARADAIKIALDNPNIEDYAKIAKEIDEKQYLKLSLFTLDVRNDYAILYDLLTKNMEKVVIPRRGSIGYMHKMYH